MYFPSYEGDNYGETLRGPLKHVSPNLYFQEWKYILKIDTWSSVIINNFLVIFLKVLLWSLLLYWTCNAFKTERIFSTLSKDYLKMGAIKGSSLS